MLRTASIMPSLGGDDLRIGRYRSPHHRYARRGGLHRRRAQGEQGLSAMAIGVSAGLGRFALRSRGESEDCGTRLFPDELCPLLRPAPDSGGRHLASCGADAAPRAIPIVAHLLEPFRSEEHTSEL